MYLEPLDQLDDLVQHSLTLNQYLMVWKMVMPKKHIDKLILINMEKATAQLVNIANRALAFSIGTSNQRC